MIRKVIKKQYAGFSLIEMIVALGLFGVVSVIVVGSILVLIASNQQQQSDQQVIVGLSTALDVMTRDIRMGGFYHCSGSTNSANNGLTETSTNNCQNGNTTLSFRELMPRLNLDSPHRVAFYYDSSNRTIMRRIGTNTPEPIIPDTINVTNARFYVTGTNNLLGASDVVQPTVTIVIVAEDTTQTNSKPFTIQTTVTQRELDI